MALSLRVPDIPRTLGGVQGQLETLQNEMMPMIGEMQGAIGALADQFGGPVRIGRNYGSVGMSYPMDMGVQSNAELDNHIIFEIYYDENSALIGAEEGTKGEPRAYTMGNSAGLGDNVGQAFDRLANTEVGEAVSGALGTATEAIGSLVGAAPGQATESVGQFMNGAFGGARNLKRLNSQIALAVPNTLVATSTANYTETKMGAVVGLLSKMGSGNMGSESIAQMGGQAARLAMETFAQLPDAFGMNLQNILEVSTRRVQNPHINKDLKVYLSESFSLYMNLRQSHKQKQLLLITLLEPLDFICIRNCNLEVYILIILHYSISQ